MSENEDLIKEIEEYRMNEKVSADVRTWFFGVLCGAVFTAWYIKSQCYWL